MPTSSQATAVRPFPSTGNEVEREVHPLSPSGAPPLPVGTRVDVRTRFIGTWGHGFEVAERTEAGYRVRRCSDGSVLPGVVPCHEISPERPSTPRW